MKQSIKIEIDSWEWIRQKDESYCDENIDGKHNADYDYDYYGDGDDEADEATRRGCYAKLWVKQSMKQSRKIEIGKILMMD